MSLNRYTAIIVLVTFFLCKSAVPSFGQYGITFNIKKPKEFENRVLQSEKSDKKKFGLPRRFMQNMMTHYNYFFNANNKLNEVIERAKAAHKDDYSQLISFYNYSLDATAAEKTELDSISFKAQTGIVLHDLRSDWADNMYLLWGASYYLQKEFDSAYLMFQFINYAFAEKEKDGYYKTIGSARDGNSAFVVSTKEKPTLTQKIFNEPPSRNDAFIWQIRNYLAQDRFAEAAGLIQILKIDPVFPERLHNDLEEVQAYSFYKQNMWDSCTKHLINALSNATNKQEKARWEYLLGQLYEETNKYTEAEEYYTKAISHTTDPIMEVYARLSLVRVNKDGGDNYIENNIATLIKMAKRDKYQDYRDIIYYMAAQMELERNDIDNAIALLLKSTQYTANNLLQRNKAFLQLAELSFGQRKYRQSYNFYDSLEISEATLKDPEAVTARKAILEQVVTNLDIIERQDSLQHIAAMPEDERKDYVKKLTRQLRKLQGLKEEGTITIGSTSLLPQEPTSLFADNTNKKGEWYFYNNTSRQKGLTDFRARWGTRPNSDNWRRSAAVMSIIRNQVNTSNNDPSQKKLSTQQPTPEVAEITFEGLYEKLPLNDEKMKVSNDSIETAMFDLGILYVQQLEDCVSGTEILEEIRERFSDHSDMAEVLYNLYYCYNKNGEADKSVNIKRIMTDKFSASNFTTIITTGKNPQSKAPQEAPTKAYEKVYDLFIEGNFEEALKEKGIADSKYGPQYWTPQLLYIETVYQIKQGSDTAAKVILNDIISRFPQSPIATKATTLLDVLNRRAQIEEELRNLVLVMPPPDTMSNQPVAIIPKKDNPVIIPPAVKKDTVVAQPLVTTPVVVNKPKTDSVVTTPIQPPPTAYTFEADKPYYVVIVLNKVDPIFVNEAKNAFYRFNRDTYYNKQMAAELADIDGENRILLISPFKNSQEATDYVDRTRPRTASEIIPWLKGGKYYFFIITGKNLDILKASKDIDKYKQFLEQHIPGKF